MGEPVARSIELSDPAATEALGRALARALPAVPSGWRILLKGDLGAGKSTLARALLRTLGHQGPVPSPTYTLIEPYDFATFIAYHVDLFRIGDEEELVHLGFDELGDGLLLVEWPERVPGLASRADLEVSLDFEGRGRVATLRPLSDRASRLVAELAAT